MIKTRFAPSPTGSLHIGGVRTALFSWLYARKHNGKFILRIEDTDRERSSDAAVKIILDSIEWLGLTYDEGPYYQTQRFDLYNEVIQILIENGLAYRCNCSKKRLEELRATQISLNHKPKYDGKCRNNPCSVSEPHVIRFKNPQSGDIVFNDLVKGVIKFSNTELDDLIIRRSDGSPTYNLTVVVDDYDMDITQVVRGDDHINNTPRQINLYSALNWKIPDFAHLPMILGHNGERLSKRHGAQSVMEYKENGFLSDALLNYLVRLGWSHGDQEIFSIDEMIEKFSFDSINHAPSSFNKDKLIWLNANYIKNKEANDLSKLIHPYLEKFHVKDTKVPKINDVIRAQQERAETLSDLADLVELFYRDPELQNNKAVDKAFSKQAGSNLSAAFKELNVLEQWTQNNILQIIKETAIKLDTKFGKIAFPLRIAMTGGKASPDLDLVLFLVGKKSSLRRIRNAIEHIREGDYE